MLELRDSDVRPEKSLSHEHDADAIDREERRRLCCRVCLSAISDRAAVFGGEHVFENPAGRVCRIVTVRAAQGLDYIGPPTLEHTWFPGHAWRVALCARCGLHVGWRFQVVNSVNSEVTHAVFHGLLTSEIVEAPE